LSNSRLPVAAASHPSRPLPPLMVLATAAAVDGVVGVGLSSNKATVVYLGRCPFLFLLHLFYSLLNARMPSDRASIFLKNRSYKPCLETVAR
jgi:hypothetical protein